MQTTLATILITLSLCLSVGAQTQTFHVVSVHKALPTEKTYKTGFNQTDVVGIVGHKKVTFEQLDTWGAAKFEVGQDYIVDKIGSDTIKIEVPGKKKTRGETFNLITVEEIPCPGDPTK